MDTPAHEVLLSANFERNLTSIEEFLHQAQAPQAFDGLLTELSETVIPNLERFPCMGRLFLARPAQSVETINSMARVTQQLKGLDSQGEIREYVMTDYLLLYARIHNKIYLLSIRHQRQLSFDFLALWGST